MNSRISHQLLVLGNGFDITCGLNSRFVQFFRPRMVDIDKNKNNRKKGWIQALSASGITAWDLILYYRKELTDKGYDVNWSDIELVVSDAIEMERNASTLPSSPFMDKQHFVTIRTLLEYFEFLQSHPWIKWPNHYLAQLNEKIEKSTGHDWAKLEEDVSQEMRKAGSLEDDEDSEYPFTLSDIFPFTYTDIEDYRDALKEQTPGLATEVVASFLCGLNTDVEKWTQNSLRSALEQEVHKLEAEFSRYLGHEVELNNDYGQASEQLMEQLLLGKVSWHGGYVTAATVLSFNYTSPSIPSIWRSESTFKFINIHGKLNGDIIFGADGTNCMDDPGAARFSKTFRIIRSGRPGGGEPIAFGAPSKEEPRETVVIKVFGHSLAKADYAYFQAIFDIVDIYTGPVELVFFYKSYCETAREELLLNISRLLDSYGASMDNRDHGKNLMHRLILEGRLSVVELP